jgi:hypothetical protein
MYEEKRRAMRTGKEHANGTNDGLSGGTAYPVSKGRR